MPSLKTLLLPTLLTLTTATTTNNCPRDWLPNTWKGDAKCCYGSMTVEIEVGAFCCIYDLNPPIEPTTTSSAVSTTSLTPEEYWSGADYCFSKIPFTARDYSDQVSAASAKAIATRTEPPANDASSTSASTSTGTGSGSGSGTGSASSATGTSTTNAGVPVATAEGRVLGGAAVAVGLFML